MDEYEAPSPEEIMEQFEVKPEIVMVENELWTLARVYLIINRNEQSLKLFMRTFERRVKEEFSNAGYVISYPDFALDTISQLKKELTKRIKDVLKKHPVYMDWLGGVRGVGAVSAGAILGIIPARKFPTISKLWKYTGYAPPEVYGGKKAYNTKIKYVLYNTGLSLIRWNPLYQGMFQRWFEEEQKRVESKGHAFMRALRKVIKCFLGHYWEMYRKILGMPYSRPYFYDVLGLKEQYVPPERAMVD